MLTDRIRRIGFVERIIDGGSLAFVVLGMLIAGATVTLGG